MGSGFEFVTSGIVGAGSTILLLAGLLTFLFSIPTSILGFFF